LGKSAGKDSISIVTLLEQIGLARARMQELWDKRGHTDDEILAASIEVDRLLNEYDQLSRFSMTKRGKCFTGRRKS
jgi:hypothetical protein